MDIALFGFGCVGQGLYDALGQSHGFKAGIQKIGVKDRHKPRKIAVKLFGNDARIAGRSTGLLGPSDSDVVCRGCG